MKKASKMLTDHTGPIVHTILRDFLILSVVIFVALFVWLKVGIQADSLVFGKYKVEGLYIKLDKKLTLTVDNTIIPKTKSNPSFRKVDKIFDRIKYLFTFFDYIELKNITYANNHLNFIFADDILYVDRDDYAIAGTIYRSEETFIVDVSMLHIKEKDINLKGKLTYHANTGILEAQGYYEAYNIEGRFTARKQDEHIKFSVDSEEFRDLKTLIKTFDLDKTVESWIVDRVQAEKYKLNALEGSINVANNEINVDFDTLKGDILFDGVKIFYQKELDPILAKSFNLTYRNKALYFDLKKPTYKSRSLEGSKIAITDLAGESKTLLKLDLKIFSPLDDVIQEVLKSYELDIPVFHIGEDAFVGLKMDIPLGESTQDDKSIILVHVDVGEGKLKYENIQLPLLKSKVTFDSREEDSIMVDAILKEGIVQIGQVKFPVLGGSGHVEKNIVTLTDIHLKESRYEGIVNGKININTQKANLKLNAKKIVIGGKEKILVLQNKLLPLTLDYSKKLQINIPSLALKIINQNKGLLIQIGKIEKIKPYLKNMPIKVDGGKLDIVKVDADTFTFKGELKRKECFLYDKNDVCHTRVPCSGKVTKNNFDFYAFGKRLHYSLAKSRIKIKDLNIDLEEFMELKKDRKKDKSNKLVIIGKNSKIRYKKHILVTDSYDIEVKANGDIAAFGSLTGDIVHFSTKGKLFSLKALRVTDTMLHPLINFEGLKNGRYSLKQLGNPDKVMNGQIIIEGGVMSDFKAYNNTLAFINAIPALATLSSPGFSQRGFKITEGVAEYRKIGDKVIFDSIYIKGSSATIAGKGELDLKKRTIKMDLAIRTAREFGKLVSSLPVLGYILMGEDKTMTIGLKISGSLDNPVVETSAAQDILSLPLKLIQRTLEAPGQIFKK